MPTEATAVETGVEREKRITEMKLERLQEKIDDFEEEYGMDSEEFRKRFESGELGDDRDFMKWDMYLDAVKELKQKKEELDQFQG